MKPFSALTQLSKSALLLLLLTACPNEYPNSSGFSQDNPLSSTFPLNFEAQWSPDRKWIAVLGLPGSTERFAYPHIYLIDAQTHVLTQTWPIYNPAQIIRDWAGPPSLSWSSDSSKLHFFQNGGNFLSVDRLFLHSLTPGSSKIETRMWQLPLKFNDPQFLGYSSPVLAPDQRSVALLEKRSDKDPEIEKLLKAGPDEGAYTELYALKTYDLETQTLTLKHQIFKSQDFQQIYPIWARDQTKLYLPYSPSFNMAEIQDNTGVFKLWTLVEIMDTQKKIALPAKELNVQNHVLSPDGEHLAVNLQTAPLVGPYGVNLTHPLESWISPDNTKPLQDTVSGSFALILNLKTGNISWFSPQSNLWNLTFWHGAHQILSRKRDSISKRDWLLWDVQKKNHVEYTRPEQPNTQAEQPLALSPFPGKQMLMGLYSPCCKSENLQTGLFLWDMEKNSLKRIGPSLKELQSDFPGVSLFEHSEYDNSKLRNQELG